MQTGRVTLRAAALAAAAAVAVAGCGKDAGMFATVSGVVTHEGAPVEGARIEFHSTTESGGQRDSFSSTTDSSGKYMIAGVGNNPGIPPGMYKVAIIKLNVKGGAQNLPKDFDAGQMDAQATAAGATGGGIIHLLPKEYATPGSSKLTATVEPGSNKDVNFNLKGKVTP